MIATVSAVMLKDVARYRDLKILYKSPNYVEDVYQADPERQKSDANGSGTRAV